MAVEWLRISRLASLSSVSAARVSSSRRAVSMATEACAASDDSSAISSRANGLAPRSAANSTPMTWLPSCSGTPSIATSPFLGDRVVDAGLAAEPLVGEVVGGRVALTRLGHQAAEAGAGRKAYGTEAGSDHAVGDPHVGVAALGVVQRQVGHVGAEQPARPVDDRGQHGVEVTQAGEVLGGVEQRRQLGLAAGPAAHHGPDPQRGDLLALQLLQRGRVGSAARAWSTGPSNSTAEASLASSSRKTFISARSSLRRVEWTPP